MTNAFERRVQRALATTNDAMARSQFVIWCYEPEKMPAMIDLLVAQGRLSEADRPHCVHWTAFKNYGELTHEEIVKAVDADEMLQAAGIRTIVAEGWDALVQGMEAVEAFLRDRFGGETEPDVRAEFEKVEKDVARLHRPSPA